MGDGIPRVVGGIQAMRMGLYRDVVPSTILRSHCTRLAAGSLEGATRPDPVGMEAATRPHQRRGWWKTRGGTASSSVGTSSDLAQGWDRERLTRRDPAGLRRVGSGADEWDLRVGSAHAAGSWHARQIRVSGLGSGRACVAGDTDRSIVASNKNGAKRGGTDGEAERRRGGKR